MNTPVVVGADGSPEATRAVLLAAHEAVRLGTGLRIVAVTAWPHLPHAVTHLPPGAVVDADAVLHEAAALARATGLAGRVETVPGLGWPADVLVRESATACLVVVGSRGVGAVAALLLGSTSTEVTSRAECPVLVSRGDQQAAEPDTAVVVGVNAGPRSAAALEAAFRYADDTGAPLLAVHAWQRPHFLTPSQTGARPRTGRAGPPR